MKKFTLDITKRLYSLTGGNDCQERLMLIKYITWPRSIRTYITYRLELSIKEMGLHEPGHWVPDLSIKNSKKPQLNFIQLLSLYNNWVTVRHIQVASTRLILNNMIAVRYWRHPWLLLCNPILSFLAWTSSYEKPSQPKCLPNHAKHMSANKPFDANFKIVKD